VLSPPSRCRIRFSFVELPEEECGGGWSPVPALLSLEVIRPAPPANLLSVEDGRWHVTVVGSA
jgi:hypothetical protein